MALGSVIGTWMPGLVRLVFMKQLDSGFGLVWVNGTERRAKLDVFLGWFEKKKV